MSVIAQLYMTNGKGNIKAWRKQLEDQDTPEMVCELISDIRKKVKEKGLEYVLYSYEPGSSFLNVSYYPSYMKNIEDPFQENPFQANPFQANVVISVPETEEDLETTVSHFLEE